ncbi:alpha-amylase domain-containing protein [Natronorubrum halophilum]|uniref:alpha-amylase domain-containing protein n=1 Tax=Natronorubrum halophilum TaxID=1702106 RepID=UPI0010C1CC86|nr:alpha-amylase domain-containing protein [Natronorubrum halophilum]
MVDNSNHEHSYHRDGVKRRTLLKTSAALGALAVGGGLFGSASARSLPEQPAVEDGTVAYQYFHAEWSEIGADVPRLAAAGVDAIWIQQPARSKLEWDDLSYDGEYGFYDERSPYGWRDPHPPVGYQPVDLRDLDSTFGTEAELESLIQACHERGISVIVDVVLNHMAAADGPDGYVELPQFDRDKHFHDYGTLGEDCELDGERAEYECNLLGLPSFDIEQSYVQDAQRNYIQRIADLGADGLRYDAAAHVWPWYFETEINALADDLGLWRVGEIWKYDVDRLLEFADTGMTVFDFPLYDAIVEAFEGGSMEALSQNAARGVAHHRPDVAVTFAQNHDTVGPGVEPDQPEGREVELAEAFVFAYAGMPMVYRSGPDDRSELDDQAFRDLVAVSQEFAHGGVVDRHVDQDTYVFEREENLLAGINKGDLAREQTVQTSWSDATLVDRTGHGEAVSVDASGQVTIEVPAEGWVMYAPDDEGDDGDGDNGEITLRVTVDVGYGESVYFTGGSDELTNWGGGIEGTWSEGNVWEVTIDDPGEFEWKTRRGPSGGTGDVWEQGDNHDENDLQPTHQGWSE